MKSNNVTIPIEVNTKFKVKDSITSNEFSENTFNELKEYFDSVEFAAWEFNFIFQRSKLRVYATYAETVMATMAFINKIQRYRINVLKEATQLANIERSKTMYQENLARFTVFFGKGYDEDTEHCKIIRKGIRDLNDMEKAFKITNRPSKFRLTHLPVPKGFKLKEVINTIRKSGIIHLYHDINNSIFNQQQITLLGYRNPHARGEVGCYFFSVSDTQNNPCSRLIRIPDDRGFTTIAELERVQVIKGGSVEVILNKNKGIYQTFKINTINRFIRFVQFYIEASNEFVSNNIKNKLSLTNLQESGENYDKLLLAVDISELENVNITSFNRIMDILRTFMDLEREEVKKGKHKSINYKLARIRPIADDTLDNCINRLILNNVITTYIETPIRIREYDTLPVVLTVNRKARIHGKSEYKYEQYALADITNRAIW